MSQHFFAAKENRPISTQAKVHLPRSSAFQQKAGGTTHAKASLDPVARCGRRKVKPALLAAARRDDADKNGW